MKTRRPLPNPCSRKSERNADTFRPCELSEKCESLGGFLHGDSHGTINYKNYRENFESDFEGCFKLEKQLLDDFELRYDGREVSGLEVLFNGIERIHDLNSHIFNSAFLDGIDEDDFIGTEIDTGEHQSTISQKIALAVGKENSHYSSFRDSDEVDDKISIPNAVDLETDPLEGLELHVNLPKQLSISPGLMADLWNSQPKDIFNSMLMRLWGEGLFEYESIEVKVMAYFLMKGFIDKKVAQKLFNGEKSKKFTKYKNKVKYLVDKNSPEWAKKFKGFKKLLTDKQWEAISLEWFYEDDEKTTQADLAQKLGISVDSYSERLEYAYKKLEGLYPELTRKPRRQKSTKTEKVKFTPKLYLLNRGKREEIKVPVKKKVSHSTAYYKRIKEWARNGTVDLARNLNSSQYASYEVSINYWVENNLTPEAILRAEEKQERGEEKKRERK